jgi:tetratricopeptide (TPR) repeat protein
VGATLSNMSILDFKANRFQDAYEKLISAVEFQKRTLAAKPKHPQYREFLNNHYNNLVYVLSELAESPWFTEATPILREASRSPDGSLDPEYASALNGYLWELVKSPANAETPPITPFHLADIRQAAEQFGQSMFYNTLGTVEFRMGNYQAAIDACTRSIELSQKEQHDAAPGPFDLAIRAMSHLQLDHADEASEYHAQFKAAAEQTQFKDDAECQNFAKEVESMFGELAKPESSANTLDND